MAFNGKIGFQNQAKVRKQNFKVVPVTTRGNRRTSYRKTPLFKRPLGTVKIDPNQFKINRNIENVNPFSGPSYSRPNPDANIQRGNIKVVVRVRPPNIRERNPSHKIVVHAIDKNIISFDPVMNSDDFFYQGTRQKGRDMLKKPNKDIKFAFDSVFGPNSTNQEIFDDTIKSTIDTVLNGYNCSVFAYGATGAGKTYTMLGSIEHPGLTTLTMQELFIRLEDMKDKWKSEIKVSYLEVYNETVLDLLNPTGPLNVLEDVHGIKISNLTTHVPENAEELMRMLNHGNSVRSQHPTDHNSESSRSHAIFQVIVGLKEHYKDFASDFKTAKLVMVDLAGSEKGSATGFNGQRFREGASINKSLLALGNCINALADGKRHIPYRDSKLTRILKDSLGGNCKTVMIANVSPSDLSFDDSYNTLKYADRAKKIKFQLKKQVMSVQACISQYGQVVDEMKERLAFLEKQLSACHCKNPKCDVAVQSDSIIPEEQHRILPESNISCKRSMNLNETVTLANDETDSFEGQRFDSTVVIYEESPRHKRKLDEIILSDETEEIDWKIEIKKRRVNSVESIHDSVFVGNAEKLKKQIVDLTRIKERQLMKKSKSASAMHSTTRSSPRGNRDNETQNVHEILMKSTDLFQMKSQIDKLEEALQEKNKYINSLHRHTYNSEDSYAKSIKSLKTLFNIVKGVNQMTSKMETECQEIFNEFLNPTTIQWGKDDNYNYRKSPQRSLTQDYKN